ncbi:hypothetical protein GWI33_007121 [Rhynchophorus ferrugineus]|uniref:Uncharacterized protein n=1 Tax=Rhynchophorus ferrugineus TaxID=354439 RepID=A0A834ITE5_RHYFE|nr:hypothetical protein GWI33_007121 [Rhynchophorus ferrugineus]
MFGVASSCLRAGMRPKRFRTLINKHKGIVLPGSQAFSEVYASVHAKLRAGIRTTNDTGIFRWLLMSRKSTHYLGGMPGPDRSTNRRQNLSSTMRRGSFRHFSAN